MNTVSLQAAWELALDAAPCRFDAPPAVFPLTMQLPGTTAQQQIGQFNTSRCDGTLTEKFPFTGQIWLRKTIRLPEALCTLPHCFLTLERTRITRLWLNGQYIGSENSLCTPHVYDISGLPAPETEIVICVQNTGYPVPGGHMTSIDTQTNWIGITGEIALDFHERIYISDLQTFPDAAARTVTVRGVLHGAKQTPVSLRTAQSPYAGISYAIPAEMMLCADANGRFEITVPLPETVPLWDEYIPAIILLCLELPNGESARAEFGLRDFKACGDHFALNGKPVMLRGKHDAMVFPLTGAAPTDFDTWLHVFRTAKAWGINHYRFHTCCPPEAAFAAADAAGMLLEPELPFWGTLDAPGGEHYDAAAQDYLLREGLRICKAFGNHPSFCMLSLGNELWGSKKLLGEMIDTLRNADPRPLYTQGSNNFQHMPMQLPQEDFWTGVRTGEGRLLRGSYAQCDAPLGKIQTAAPSTNWDYEAYLVPQQEPAADCAEPAQQELVIQCGTGTAQVTADAQEKVLYPTVPVVTHEIGQYNCYPDFDEIPKYTGVLEARNLEIFRERLEQAGMGSQAREFFRCAGAFSRDCYKNEIEAAMRSPHIAGFQLLDLQDFPGQGTALVGMLNALLENKGFIQPEEWRGFCGDLVPLARFDSFVLEQGSEFRADIFLRISRPHLKAQTLDLFLECGISQQHCQFAVPEHASGLISLGRFAYRLPENLTGAVKLSLLLHDENIENTWNLTVLPHVSPVPEVITAHSYSEAAPYLQAGERVLLLPDGITEKVEGFYCTDFWNYHMFRIISESMGKKEPVGTMGLCIDTAHPVSRAMFSESHSTPQWYSAVTHADCAVLDEAPAGYRPTVQMIDNVERNHRLGLLFETAVGSGKLLICTVRFAEAPDDLCMNNLHHAIADYIRSDTFAPEPALSPDLLRRLFG